MIGYPSHTKELEKQDISERLRPQEKLPVGRVCVENRKGIAGKWNSTLKAMKSGVCSWGSKETGPMRQSCLSVDCGKSSLMIWKGTG